MVKKDNLDTKAHSNKGRSTSEPSFEAEHADSECECNSLKNALHSCQETLEACQKDQKNWKDKFVLLSADYDNFRRRVEQDQAKWMVNVQAQLIQDILPVIDNFERALERKEEIPTELKAWLDGMVLIHNELSKFLTNYNVTEIDCSAMFDPHIHEALMEVESSDHKPGEIVNVLQKGYQIKNKIIRPAKVAVAK